MNRETELENQDKAVQTIALIKLIQFKNMIRRNCDLSFIIFAGDQIQSGYKKNKKSYDHNEIEYAGYLSPCASKSIPIATTIGNHDENSENYSYHSIPNKSDLGLYCKMIY
ncbi:MAG: metallophosphoesterase [Intestinibacter bartlettii]